MKYKYRIEYQEVVGYNDDNYFHEKYPLRELRIKYTNDLKKAKQLVKKYDGDLYKLKTKTAYFEEE